MTLSKHDKCETDSFASEFVRRTTLLPLCCA